MMTPNGNRGKFVYGLRVTGLDDVTELSEPTDHPAGGIAVHLSQSTQSAPAAHPLDRHRNIRVLSTGHVLDLDRKYGRATFFGPPISPDQLAHPYLGPVAITFNRWAGREVFHAGAFINDGRAWVLIGPRTAGKSTLTAALAASGIAILADDIVVVDGSTAFSGPRSIDLRQAIPPGATAGPLPASGPARLGTRTRVALPPTASRWPLGGWFFLDWDERPTLEPIPIWSMLRRLSVHRSTPALPSDPAHLLALSALPGWILRRPRQWSELAGTVETLLAVTAASEDKTAQSRAAPTMAGPR